MFIYWDAISYGDSIIVTAEYDCVLSRTTLEASIFCSPSKMVQKWQVFSFKEEGRWHGILYRLQTKYFVNTSGSSEHDAKFGNLLKDEEGYVGNNKNKLKKKALQISRGGRRWSAVRRRKEIMSMMISMQSNPGAQSEGTNARGGTIPIYLGPKIYSARDHSACLKEESNTGVRNWVWPHVKKPQEEMTEMEWPSFHLPIFWALSWFKWTTWMRIPLLPTYLLNP